MKQASNISIAPDDEGEKPTVDVKQQRENMATVQEVKNNMYERGEMFIQLLSGSRCPFNFMYFCMLFACYCLCMQYIT